MAQPFDLRNLTLGGEPRPVADHIETGAAAGTTLPAATFAASPNGVLVWHRVFQSSQSLPQWFDRNGKRLGVRWRGRRVLEPRSLTGRYETGRRHPRSADKDPRHLDL